MTDQIIPSPDHTILDLLFQQETQINYCPHIMHDIAYTLGISTDELESFLGIMAWVGIIKYQLKNEEIMLIIRIGGKS